MEILKGPKIPKEISLPKKFKKRQGEDPRGKAKYTLLYENPDEKSSLLDFVELYKVDKLAARVKYFNSTHRHYLTRLCLFEWDNGDYSISLIKTTYGISNTGKMFNRSKKLRSIIFKSGKYWMTGGNGVSPLKYQDLFSFTSENEVLQVLKPRIHFLETLSEFKFNSEITFNTIVKEKLSSLKDFYRYYFKVPYNIAKLLEKVKFKEHYIPHKYRLAKYRGVFMNIQNLTEEMVMWPHFSDALHMALALGEKINCKWGLKRLKDEHDKWSKTIANLILRSEVERNLIIRKDLAGFEQFSGYRLLKTNKDMLFEGLRQNHCVGTYIGSVESGQCAIFDVENYTLQLKIATDIFSNDRRTCYMGQFLGYSNELPPQELTDKIKKIIRDYNESEFFRSFDNDKSYAIDSHIF